MKKVEQVEGRLGEAGGENGGGEFVKKGMNWGKVMEEGMAKVEEGNRAAELREVIGREEMEVSEEVKNHPLVRMGLMEMVWKNGEKVEDSDYFIGVVRGGENLRMALENGSLDGWLDEFGEIYREVYGGEPWREFLECEGEGCEKKVGINEAFGLGEKEYLPLGELEMGRERMEKCPECGEEMREVWGEGEVREFLKGEMSHDVNGAFLFGGDGKMSGFSYSWFDTPRNIWEEKLVKDFGMEGVENEVRMKECMKLKGGEMDEEFLFWNEWGVNSEARSGMQSLQLMKEVTTLGAKRAKERGRERMELFGTTMLGTNAMSVYRKMEAEIIFQREDGLVLMRNFVMRTGEVASGLVGRLEARAKRQQKLK